jgi:hypothetical protein
MNLAEQIDNHRGTPYLRVLLSYNHSKNILTSNAYELSVMLEKLENHEIQQKMGRNEFQKRFIDFEGHIVRYLHNFVTAVMTLREHTRVVMRSDLMSEAHKARYVAKVKEIFDQSNLARFMQDLRRYYFHYGIPNIEHITAIHPKENTQIFLDLTHLSQWKDWTANGRLFIESHIPKIRLRTLVNDYLKMAMEFNQWFIMDFSEEYSGILRDLDELKERWAQISKSNLK